MVFRGKPSKACQRCRERKLRCDLRKVSCSSCIRVGVQCTGYRDTETLRIHDQTQTVQAKFLSGTAMPHTNKQTFSISPTYLPLDLQIQARELFAYITDFSRTWHFLYPYFDRDIAPEHLKLSIDAVSLAFLSHQAYSTAALTLSRQKYVAALRKTNIALQYPKTAKLETTLDTSLLLDLFEKITTPAIIMDDTHHAHVNGALALVKLRGLGEFRDSASLSALMRLVMNIIISCVSKGDPVPDEIQDVRMHMAKYWNVTDPKWRLNGLMIETTNLVSKTSHGKLRHEERITKYVELDKKFEQLALEAPPSWPYKRIAVDERSERILGDFFDVYPDRTVTQMWNVLRLARIMLCEHVVDECQEKDDEHSKLDSKRCRAAIESLVKDICASAPQMTDCIFAARQKVSPLHSDSPSVPHSHTFSHYLDTYILLFALYVAAWSRNCPPSSRAWIERQLDHIAKHFGIKEAAEVREILQRENQDVRVGPWDVYRLLGSYAYAA